jgi:hypothetical protein
MKTKTKRVLSVMYFIISSILLQKTFKNHGKQSN